MTAVKRRRPRRGLVVTVTDGRGRPVPSRALGRFLAAAAPAGADGHVTIALIGDAAMRRLNRQFLGHDYATDVLSFPLARERNFEVRTSKFEVPGPKGLSRAPAGPGPGARRAPWATWPLPSGWLAARRGRSGIRSRLNSGFWPFMGFCTSWGTITKPTRGRWAGSRSAFAGAPVCLWA